MPEKVTKNAVGAPPAVKFVPVIVTVVPTGPETGVKLEMVGEEATVTVKIGVVTVKHWMAEDR